MFIDTKGYYLEWIREEWKKEQDLDRLTQMYLRPNQFLKDMAPEFKKIESEMESLFWNSKFIKSEN